ncbi:MAG: hypothetical protein R2864_04170 [Syntrophotaleaceae bacterium]
MKLNQVAVQVGNYACYPLQIALFVPSFAGQKFFRPKRRHPRCWPATTSPRGRQGFLAKLWRSQPSWALGVWLLLAPVFLGAGYWSLRALLMRWPKSPVVSVGNNA